MAVTQYIGAAYVAHGWTVWNAATSYDNMYVVEYQNGNYIAKKNVPAGNAPAGNHGDNEYWAYFGVKSAQIEEWRKETEVLTGLYDNLSAALSTSIITLGGKNDGTIDIGPIINQYTETTDIYLPAGTYLINTPVTLNHNLIGEVPTAGRTGTIIKSGISNNYIFTVNKNDVNIANITVICSGNETGTLLYQHSSSALCLLTNVSIWYHGGDACINISPTVNISRYLLINQLTIYCNSTNNENQTGILANNCGDSRFSDITIFCAVKGMILNSSNIHMENTHIWCGVNNPTGSTPPMSNERWVKTVGLVLNGNSYIFNNLYLDTCYTYFESNSNSSTKITGLKIWCDSTIPATNPEPGYLVKTSFTDDFVVFGGILYFRIPGYKYNNLGCVYHNVNIVTQLITVEKPICYYFRDCRYFIPSDTVQPYRIVAYVSTLAAGITQFYIGCNDTLYKVIVTHEKAFYVPVNKGNTEIELYLKSEPGLKTIAIKTIGTPMFIEHISSSPNLGLVNYETLKSQNLNNFSLPFIESIEGFTQITEPEA